MSNHPLDPLTADEVAATSGILFRDKGLSKSVRFMNVELREPAPLRSDPTAVVDRETFVVLRDRAAGTTIEAVVSLTRDAVVSWREIPGAQLDAGGGVVVTAIIGLPRQRRDTERAQEMGQRVILLFYPSRHTETHSQ